MSKKCKWRRWAVSVALGALVFLFGGCGRSEKSDEIHIGYFNNITHAQALYMKSEHTLETTFGEEISIDWISFNAGPSEVEALFAGQIDIGYIGPVPAITANVKSHGDVSILTGATMAGSELITVAESGITKVEDLAGKTVAIPQIGNTQHLCLLKLLADHGLETVENGGNVTVTAVENADIQNMMDQGNVDAALVPEPWGTTLVDLGAKLVLDYDEVYQGGDYPVAVVVVRNDYLKANPELVEQFLQCHEEVTQTIRENKEEAAKIINEEMLLATGKNIGEDLCQKAFSKIIFATDVNEDVIHEFGEISLKHGFINRPYEDIFAEWE